MGICCCLRDLHDVDGLGIIAFPGLRIETWGTQFFVESAPMKHARQAQLAAPQVLLVGQCLYAGKFFAF